MLAVPHTADAGSIDLAAPIGPQVDLRPVVWLQALPQFRGDRWPNLAASRCRGNPTFVLTNGPSWLGAANRPGGFGSIKLNEPLAIFNQYVAWTNGLALSDFAAFAWVYVRNTNDPAYIVQFGSTLSFLVVGIASGGHLRLTDDLTFNKQSAIGVTGHAWYHVGVTYRAASSSGTFYINGRPVGTFAQTLNPGSGASKIGGSGSLASGIYLDDVQIYNRTLSDAQAVFVTADSHVGNVSRLERTPSLWFLAESITTPGTLELMTLGVLLCPPQVSTVGGASVPIAACPSTTSVSSPVFQGGAQLPLLLNSVQVAAGAAITAGAAVELAALSVEQHSTGISFSSQTSLVLAALPISGTAYEPRIEAGADFSLAPIATDVRYGGLAVTAGGALHIATAPIGLQASEPQPVGGASVSLPAHQLLVALQSLLFTELASLPKYPGSGTFVRVGLTGVFVHNCLTGEFERHTPTGSFERRD